MAQELRADYPFPFLSVPLENVVRIHASSGTTGKRKVLCYTQKDIDDGANMFARCYEIAGLTRRDRVQIAVGYGLWTAGVGFQLGCERFGAVALPVGPGNLDIQFEVMADLQATVFCCTASMGLLMAEEIQRRNLMTIRIERGQTTSSSEDRAITARLEDAIRRNLLVRGKVKLVDYGTVPRTERKSKRGSLMKETTRNRFPVSNQLPGLAELSLNGKWKSYLFLFLSPPNGGTILYICIETDRNNLEPCQNNQSFLPSTVSCE